MKLFLAVVLGLLSPSLIMLGVLTLTLIAPPAPLEIQWLSKLLEGGLCLFAGLTMLYAFKRILKSLH